MRLRKPCEHGLYDSHWVNWQTTGTQPINRCPGGQLLPEGALVIEKVDGEWLKKARQKVASALGEAVGHERRNTLTVETFVGIADFLLDNLASETDLNLGRIADALASQVGESG